MEEARARAAPIPATGGGPRRATLTDGTRIWSLHAKEALVIDRQVRAYLETFRCDDAQPTVVDAGAHIGLLGLRVRRRYPGARVVAFEPLPPTYAVLAQNAAEQGFAAVNSALGREREVADFTYFPRSPSMSSRHREELADDLPSLAEMIRTTVRHPPRGLRSARWVPPAMAPLLARWIRLGASTYRCPVRRLSDEIADRGIERIDLLKIDVEGAELDLLNGIDAAHWPRVRHLICEVHDRDGRVREVCRLLSDRGFGRIEQRWGVSSGAAPLAIVEAFRARRADGAAGLGFQE